MSYDVVALGEGLLRLSPNGLEPFDQADTFKLHVGGSEANVVVGLARLGWRTTWLSRLPRGRLGDRIVAALRAQGVDTTHVVRAADGRVGCYWLEAGPTPRKATVTYDRLGSAMTHFTTTDLPEKVFARGHGKLLHTSGITLALSELASSATLEALKRAKAAGWAVSFDTNYRSQMSTPEEAGEACSNAIEYADILHVPRRDAVLLFGADAEAPAEEILSMLKGRFQGRIIVLTDGSGRVHASTAAGDVLIEEAVSAQPVDRVGRGDAFMAGFLHGLLSQAAGTEGVRHGLRWGVVLAALKYATPGDMPLVDMDTAAELVRSGVSSDVDR